MVQTKDSEIALQPALGEGREFAVRVVFKLKSLLTAQLLFISRERSQATVGQLLRTIWNKHDTEKEYIY